MTLVKYASILAASAAMLASPLSAMTQTTVPTSNDPHAVAAGSYTLETRHARILWKVLHMGFSEWYGDFSGATGAAHFDPTNPAANSIEITIPTASVSTTNSTLDGELKSPDWFGAAAFPTIAFKSTSVTFRGPGAADVAGDLTFHGVTRPVTLAVKFRAVGSNPMTKHYTVGFDATTSIKRSDFGVGKDVPVVGDDVDIVISAPFEKQG